jgi:chromosome partitioning protein
MPTVISFASQKGGVGKTTSAIHLASAFALGGYRTLLMDLDPQGSVHSALGISKRPERGVQELFCDSEIPIKDLIQHSEHENLEYLLSNMGQLTEEREVLQAASDYYFLTQRLEELPENEYDFILIDSPAAINSLSINGVIAADLVIVPLQCEALAIKSLKRFLSAFRELQSSVEPNLRIAGVLLTMYNRGIRAHQQVVRQVYQALGDSVFETIIPECPHIVEASALGVDVIRQRLNSIGATGYIRLANELLDRFRLR